MNKVQKLPSIDVWKEHWPTDRLIEEQATNPRSFERGFRQSAFSDSERMFPSFESCYTPGIVVGEIIRRGYPTFAGVDLAGDKRPGNVIFVVAVEPGSQRRYPVEVLVGAWKSPEVAAQLAGVRQRHQNLRVIMVENNGYQQSLVDWIKQTPGDNQYWFMVEPYTTGFASKVNPVFGMPGMEIEFKNKAWVIPSAEFEGHPPHCRCGWCVWKGEMHDYPMGATTDTCVKPGSLVTTRRGLVPIERVVEGDYVLTHRSRFRLVTGTTSRRHVGEAVVLRPTGRRELVITPEHPIWSAPAYFDRTHLPGQKKSCNRVIPTVWSFKASEELHAGKLATGNFVFSPIPRSEVGTAPPRLDLAAYLPDPRKHATQWSVGDDEISYRGSRTMPRHLVVDEEIAILIGLFIAEGSVGRHKTMPSFAFNKKETHLQYFVVDVAKRRLNSGTTVNLSRVDGGMRVGIQSAIAGRLFSSFGCRDEKGIPWEWWWSWPSQTRLQVVRGWLIGDGHIKRKSKKNPSFSAVSISWNWLYQTQIALGSRGLVPVFGTFKQPGHFQGRPCNQKPAWRMMLSCSDSAKLLEAPSPLEAIHWGQHGCIARDRTNSSLRPCGDGIAIKLRNVRREPYDGMVYNLHVEEDESYVVDGIAVHNCMAMFFAREAISKWGTGMTMGVGGTGGLTGLNDR